jgi:hypothetical protein
MPVERICLVITAAVLVIALFFGWDLSVRVG